MSVAVASTFEDHLVAIGALTAGFKAGQGGRRTAAYRSLLERTGLEPSAFADAVAAHHVLPRVSLPACL